jgi:hypothetical protein
VDDDTGRIDGGRRVLSPPTDGPDAPPPVCEVTGVATLVVTVPGTGLDKAVLIIPVRHFLISDPMPPPSLNSDIEVQMQKKKSRRRLKWETKIQDLKIIRKNPQQLLKRNLTEINYGCKEENLVDGYDMGMG